MGSVTPKPKKTTRIALIVSIVSAAIGAALFLGVILFAGTYFREMNNRASDYSATLQTLESAPKTFTLGEVAAIGPYNITTSIQKDYTPSQTEAEAAQKELDRKQRFNSINNYPDNYGYSLTEETGQYVRVTLHLKYDAARANYDDLSTSSKDWVQQLADMTLNTNRPLVLTPDIETYKTSKELVAAAKSNEGATLALLYRIPKAETSLTLKYDITIFTKVSSFVGTEGMPSKEYKYTITVQ